MIPTTGSNSVPLIQYTQLSPTEYSQQTLGVKSGMRIETDQIRLEPILLDRDVPELWKVYKNHPELWTWMPHGPAMTYEEFYDVQAKFCAAKDFFNWSVYVSAPSSAQSDEGVSIKEEEEKKEKEKKKWVLCGSICLLDISLPFRRFEVGSIWFHPSVHGTFVVLETTYALLRFSFEQLQAGRVQWKTHFKNIASQKAAVKLGFDLDGIHRKHMIHMDGTWRHTYYYSITDDDWFGREEETVDGRPNLDVAAAAAALISEGMNDGQATSKGRQHRLEQLMASRKNEGKALPATIALGKALV
ncbi:hypothetical protein BX616_002673 [Lobosporangium transversale]|uniref:Acyl-CoA N-acyltransferase n=1 Tax=Lobosporangium transversale TaxID=64571 RepID=A0A1Y2GAT3_9FUNG|nr:acyl-CoA N-acyltransferase [Lobosporangium transversale]KAF9916843.1 hypothetical protein BX616_002673 [Lobosporangium transversale]ORZ05865.1 acyl-CoA N-acyltransferase [Lobosporangium transversale]|eukprot:XP_021877246.1 acyl-CoA N-acyltransferase [Lobosporangium transversale]